jgi:hypothetical protein
LGDLRVKWFDGVSASAGDEHALFNFVNKTLQAYVAKTQCVGFDVVYEDLTQRAAELELPPDIVERTRQAIGYFYSGGKQGQYDRSLRGAISVAAGMIDIDWKEFGRDSWCDDDRLTKIAGYGRRTTNVTHD